METKSYSKGVLMYLLLSCIGLTACVPASQTGTSYSRGEARTVQRVKIGQIIDVTPVQIEGTKSGAGGLVGGAVGGIAGSTGSGTTGDIVGVLAGTAGAIVGAKAEEALTRADGEEYTIRLENGDVISVVQAIDPEAEAIVAGDSVKLLTQGGTYRVVRLPNAQ
jgi:outer membrane lipoprotein SlyB